MKRSYNYLWRLIQRFARQNTILLAFILLRAFLLSGITIGLILFSAKVIGILQESHSMEYIISFILKCLLFIFAMQIVNELLEYYIEAKKRLLIEVQNSETIRKSMKMDFQNLESAQIQELLRKQDEYTNMTGGIYKVLYSLLEKGSNAFFTVSFSFVMILMSFRTMNFGGRLKYELFLFALVIGSAIINQKLQKRLNETTQQYLNNCIEGNSISIYYLYNVLFGYETGKDLRIFQQEKFVLDGIQKAVDIYDSAGRDYARECRKKKYVTATITTVTAAGAYLGVAIQAYFGIIGIEKVIQVTGGIAYFFNGIAEIFDVFSEFILLASYSKEFVEFMETKEESEKKIDLTANTAEPVIECEDLWFEYPGTEKSVLKGVSLSIRKGERIALVGRNGCGKSTLIKLLCGFYDTSSGSIKWKGRDITGYSKEEYFTFLSCVFQDFILLDLPLNENVAASGCFDIDKVSSALNKVGLLERIFACEYGMDTCIGKSVYDNGVDFSGGEKQKIAIARAIYKEAEVQIMDEPTASLDPISEVEIYSDFDNIIAYDAAIYISHRLASCKFCDRIYVMDEGVIAEQGTHDELMKQQGIYYKMWNMQAKHYGQ